MPDGRDARCFEPAAARFFRDLKAHNDREWFTAHRADYDRLVRMPLEALAAGPAAGYGDPHVMRPNRDVRFSTDKSPYRLNGALFSGDVGGVYLDVDAAGIQAGGGLYEPSRDQRQRARAVIDEAPAAARELDRLVKELVADGFELAGPSLATAPRGYPRDHPRIDLLRLQHYAATTHLPLTATEGEIAAAWRSVGPLIAWADRHVGPAAEDGRR